MKYLYPPNHTVSYGPSNDECCGHVFNFYPHIPHIIISHLIINPIPFTPFYTIIICYHRFIETSKRVSAIQVAGYNERGPETDDPNVFDITPGSGMIRGPTVSVVSAVGAPPKDINRFENHAMVQQRLSETSWHEKHNDNTFSGGKKGSTSATGLGHGHVTLTMKDTLQQRFEEAAASDTRIDALYPMPIQITFKPRKNLRYNSRFRFTCEYGNAFDVILQGEGTYEEHEHQPLQPFPKK